MVIELNHTRTQGVNLLMLSARHCSDEIMGENSHVRCECVRACVLMYLYVSIYLRVLKLFARFRSKLFWG